MTGAAASPGTTSAMRSTRTTEAIAKGQNRVLLVMATGTGKTYTAFQIIWRLWKSGRKKRVLYLADRNVLIDQTMVNDFRPFKDAMAKLSTRTKTIETVDGDDGDDRDRHRLRRGGSTSRTRSTSGCTRRSPGPRSDRSSSGSSRRASSTSSSSTSATAAAPTTMRRGARSSTTSPPRRRSA